MAFQTKSQTETPHLLFLLDHTFVTIHLKQEFEINFWKTTVKSDTDTDRNPGFMPLRDKSTFLSWLAIV